MFDPKDKDDDKLRTLRSDFESCIDHQRDAQAEAHRAARFYHNSDLEGQWESADLKYLRDNGRVAFTFNLVKSKVRQFVGQVKDSQREAVAEGEGGEDAFTAEILNSISDRCYKIGGFKNMQRDVLRDGTISGQKAIRLHVEPDSERPTHVKIAGTLIPGYEMHWDSASRVSDRSDARYWFWDRWLSKWEFHKLYPDSDFDAMLKKGDAREDGDLGGPDWSEDDVQHGSESEDMYDRGRHNRYYYDRNRNKLRVIHAEYRIPEQVYYAVHPQSGVSEEVSKGIADKWQDLADAGAVPPDMRIAKVWRDRIYNVQWVGPEILYDDWLNEPFDGFSAVPFTYEIDSETGTSYGLIRDLFDPQMEVNKSHSVGLENLVAQSKPGVRVEEEAVKDVSTFETTEKTTGSVSVVARDALVEGRIQDRQVAQVSPAVVQRLESSIAMLDKISNINTDEATPAGGAEAAQTVQLRYRKSLLGMSDPLDSFELFKQELKARVLQIIIRAMPDSQIAEYLGNKERFQVQQGPTGMIVMEIDKATGQPENVAELQKVRTLRYDVQLEVSSENNTLRLMEGQSLIALQGAGVPVSPEVIIDKTVSSRSDRERLKEFAEEQAAAQAQSMQMQQKQAEAQIAQTLAIEGGKVQETQRHNMATESLKYQEQTGDQQLKLADILQKADSTEAKALSEVVKAIQQRQMQRESIAADFQRKGDIR